MWTAKPVSTMLTISLDFESMIATWPASRSVTEKKFCQSRLCSGFLGRWAGGTIIFHDFFMSPSDISGGWGASIWM